MTVAGLADSPWSIQPQGDRTLLLVHECQGQASVDTGKKCAALAHALRHAAIPGITDIVPAFSTVALHYQPTLFGASTSIKSLSAQVHKVLSARLEGPDAPVTSRTVDIPVCYGGQHGPDLEHVAAHCQLSSAEVIQLHSDGAAYVFMLGFAPGAPYIGMHDQRLDIARRNTPRLALPAGSVAMANRQTIIYPNASPGGWHVIGATPLSLFDASREPAAVLQPGDRVCFVPISPSEFHCLKQAQA